MRGGKGGVSRVQFCGGGRAGDWVMYLRNCSPELRMNWRSSFIVGMRLGG